MPRELFAEFNQLLPVASSVVLMNFTDQSDGTREIQLRCSGRGGFADQSLAYSLVSNG